MERQQDKSGLKVVFRGDPDLLPLLNLKLELTIIVQKPFVTAIPLLPTAPEFIGGEVLQPFLGLQTFGEAQREFLLKKGVIRDNTFYVFFPSSIRVDQKVNKIFLNTYEAFLREIPRNLRSNFGRIILYEQGSGENSIQNQKFRCSESMGQLFKQQIEKKLQSLGADLVSGQQGTKGLQTFYRSRLALSQLYRTIGVQQKCGEMLQLAWQEMLTNQRYFGEPHLLPPFIEKNYKNLLQNFNAPDSCLKTACFAFLRLYQLQLETMNYCQALRSLRRFIENSCGLIFTAGRGKLEISRGIWTLSIIDEAGEVASRLGRNYPTFLNPQRQVQYQNLAIFIAKAYRNAVEQIGSVLYGFSHLSNYPRQLSSQISLSLQKLSKRNERTLILAPEPSFLVGKVGQNIMLALGGAEAFKLIYLKSLTVLHELLARSSAHQRNARALRLVLLKTYLSCPQAHLLELSSQIGKNIQENSVLSYAQGILIRAQKNLMLQEDEVQVSEALQKRALRYSIDKDNFINRNREQELLWPQLRFLEEYYRLIILLASFRAEKISKKGEKEESLNLSSSISLLKLPQRTDNVVRLLLAPDLIQLPQLWKSTASLVREVFLLERGEDPCIEGQIKVRMGIMLGAELIERQGIQILQLRVNNQQLSNLLPLQEQSLMNLSMEVSDVNKVIKNIPLSLQKARLLPQSSLQFECSLKTDACLIFLLRQLRIQIGGITCFYVNKSLQQQELRSLEQEERVGKKRARKYSSFQEKLRQQEFSHLLNRSEALALSYLSYNTLLLTPDMVQVAPLVQQTDNSSQSSLLNMIKQNNCPSPLYFGIWTPLSFILKVPQSLQSQSVSVPLDKILMTAGENEEISEWFLIGKEWINCKQQNNLQLQVGVYGVTIIGMVKTVGGKQMKGQRKPRKDSEMSRSAMSSLASWQRGEFVRLQIEIKQGDYSYKVQSSVSCSKLNPFEIRYSYCENLEEYSVLNLSQIVFSVTPQNSEPFQLLPGEQIRICESNLNIYPYIKVGQAKDSLENIPNFTSSFQLKKFIKKQLLKPQRIQTCELSIRNLNERLFRPLQIVQIVSSEVGSITILEQGKGFQLVGKVQGQLRRDGSGIIDLFLIPLKSGKLVLPSLLIGNKKGLWKDQLFLQVVK